MHSIEDGRTPEIQPAQLRALLPLRHAHHQLVRAAECAAALSGGHWTFFHTMPFVRGEVRDDHPRRVRPPWVPQVRAGLPFRTGIVCSSQPVEGSVRRRI